MRRPSVRIVARSSGRPTERLERRVESMEISAHLTACEIDEIREEVDIAICLFLEKCIRLLQSEVLESVDIGLDIYFQGSDDDLYWEVQRVEESLVTHEDSILFLSTL